MLHPALYMHAIPELEQDPADQIGDLVFGSPGVGQSAPHGSKVARAGDADEREDGGSARRMNES